MASAKIVHRKLIGILCLVAIVLTVLSFFQHQKLKTVTLKTETHPVATDVAAPAFSRGKIAGQAVPENDDELDSLKAELDELERKLEAANTGFCEEIVAENEQEEEERERQRTHMRYIAESEFGSLFDKLSLSPDEIEKFKDFYVEKMMGMAGNESISVPHEPPSAEEKAETKRRTDRVEAEFEEKIRELLGNADYEIYTAYNDRYSSRSSVSNFTSTIALGDALTKKQQEALVEIFYKEQGQAQNELIKKGPDEALPEKAIDEQLEDAASIHSNIMAEAEGILTTSQLEAMEKYFKRERIYMEQTLKFAIGP